MTLLEIKQAVDAGTSVYWSNEAYQVIKDAKGQYLIKHTGGICIGLTWADGVTLNADEKDFFCKVSLCVIRPELRALLIPVGDSYVEHLDDNQLFTYRYLNEGQDGEQFQILTANGFEEAYTTDFDFIT